jgi:hypothetical protein
MKSALKFIWSMATGAVLGFIKIIASVSIGLVLNWGFLICGAVIIGVSNVSSLRDSPNTSTWTVPTIVLALIGLGFPLLYLVLGQKQGIEMAMRHLYRQYPEKVFEWLMLLLSRLLQTLPEGEGAISYDSFKQVLNRIPEMPFPIRIILRYYLGKEGFRMLAKEMALDPDLRNHNEAALTEKYAVKMDALIQNEVLQVSTVPFWIVFAVNVVCLIGFWIWFF